jgi:hypothetical protein
MKISRIPRQLPEMKIQKTKYDGLDSFNDYKIEMSYGQLVAIRNALEQKHDDPLSDELHAELNYYLQNIPGPGESSDAFKAERDAATKGPEEAGAQVNPEDAGGPSSDTELEAGAALPPPPGEEMGAEPPMGGPEAGAEGPGGPGGEFQEGPKLSPEERDIIDRSLQGGPSARPTGVRMGGGPGSLPRPPVE